MARTDRDRGNRPHLVRSARVAAISAATFAVALVAASWTGTGMGPITRGVESLAAQSGTFLDHVASWLPLGFAYGAGVVSAANPCGFVMLPAYVGLFVGSSRRARVSAASRFLRAALVSVSTTAGFVFVFAVAGGVVALAARAVAGTLPWIGLATGAAMTVAGARLVLGSEGLVPRTNLPGMAPPGEGVPGFVAFGVAYALASLSCTLPVFVAVVGGASASPTVKRLVGELLAYALGMASVVTVATFLIAALQSAAARRLATFGRVAHIGGAALLLLAGAYVTYYWLTVGGLLART